MIAYTFALKDESKGISGCAVLWKDEQTGDDLWIIDGAKASGNMVVKDMQRSFKTESEARKILADEGYKCDGTI
jgi:hypothetical protein